MISAKDIFLSLFSAAVWYVFIYYWLFVLKHPVVLWKAALILLVLACIGVLACPLLHKTDAWQQLWKGD